MTPPSIGSTPKGFYWSLIGMAASLGWLVLLLPTPYSTSGIQLFGLWMLLGSAVGVVYFRLAQSYGAAVGSIGLMILLTIPRFWSVSIHEDWLEGVVWLLLWGLMEAAGQHILATIAWGIFATILFFVTGLTPLIVVASFAIIQRTDAEHKSRFLLGLLIPFTAILAVSAQFQGPRKGLLDYSFSISDLVQSISSVPEWVLLFAGVGTWAALHRRYSDPLARQTLFFVFLSAVCSTLSLTNFIHGHLGFLAMIAPLAAIGVGRLLYRGTLTNEEKIPPAMWACVLLAIATIRAAWILVGYAHHGDLFRNRLAPLLERLTNY